MLPSFCRDVATVKRPKLVDDRGKQVPDYSKLDGHEVPGCSFQPVQGETAWGEQGTPVTLRATLYMPPDSDVKAGDLVEVNGRTYAISGSPLDWSSPSGATSSIVCNLIDWDDAQ